MKNKRLILAAVIGCGVSWCGFAAMAAPAGEEAIKFEAANGDAVDAYQGTIMVPEDRGNSDSRQIPLTYVRFPATSDKAGPPIIYLSGGPGGSGIRTARGQRFPMFMALRQHGDVIALDQRGTGQSDILPNCASNKRVPSERPVSDAEFVAINRAALQECLAFWRAEGVAVEGYNTVQSAADLDDLRRHLGAEKVTLWGISYGSHLALAAIKAMGDRIERVVIASAEGLDQTVKLPARTDDYFGRLQEVIDQDPAAKAAYPDIKALMRRVHAKLDAEPVLLQVPLRAGGTAPYMFQRRDMQMVASAMVSDPQRAGQLLSLYLAVDNGIVEPLAGLLGRFMVPGQPLRMDAMSTAMDIASGMTPARAARIAEQARTALLKDFLNFSYHYDGVAPELDLGDAFRAKPESDVPVLLFSGTLDGRTYVESQREATAGLVNLQAVTVENAGHNLFMSTPEVQLTIDRFLNGEPLRTTVITLDPPSLAPAF